MAIEFKGVTYPNNTAINIADVGEEDSEAVLCRTDLTSCCAYTPTQPGQGHWVYPNGTTVGNRPSGEDFFRSRGTMSVRLHKMSHVTKPTGKFCCEVPSIANPDATICVVLGKRL